MNTNVSLADAVRGLLVICLYILYRLEVQGMPASACLPAGRETARIARLTARW